MERRNFLTHAANGVAGMAALQLLQREGFTQSDSTTSSGLHHPSHAKHVIHIFLGGGLSHIDSFDYKPELEKFHDTDLPSEFGTAEPFMGRAGRLHRSHYEFKQRGESGLWMSNLFPQLCEIADELTVINSMVAETANHTPGSFQANTGFRQMGFPAMGSWLSYGLGNESDDLPSFIVLPDDRGLPNAVGGAFSWSSGFLPPEHQGVTFNTKGGPPILDLQPASGLAKGAQQERMKLLNELNKIHLEKQVRTDPLRARLQSYELAARMQTAIPEAMDFTSEPQHVRELYGLDRDECRGTASNCLAARRLIERGVRTVQLWTGDGISWDSHTDITGPGYKNHTGEALRIDRPIAGLIRDLRQRNLLESTVVMVTTEFGRTPYAQAGSGKLSKGRDHHPEGFTNILAGGGFKPGFAYGGTDPIGYSAIVNPVSTYDMHATILHQLGIDHEKLSFYHNGIQRRLTNVHGHVVHDILS